MNMLDWQSIDRSPLIRAMEMMLKVIFYIKSRQFKDDGLIEIILESFVGHVIDLSRAIRIRLL